jgi:hypothetical protein
MRDVNLMRVFEPAELKWTYVFCADVTRAARDFRRLFEDQAKSTLRFMNKRNSRSGILRGPLAAQRYSLQTLHDLPKQTGIRITFRKGDPDPAYTDPDLCADHEQLQASSISIPWASTEGSLSPKV